MTQTVMAVASTAPFFRLIKSKPDRCKACNPEIQLSVLESTILTEGLVWVALIMTMEQVELDSRSVTQEAHFLIST